MAAYDCHTIDESENIVRNGHVHSRLHEIAQHANNSKYEPHILAKQVVQFDHLLTPDECQTLIHLAKTRYGFQHSLVVGGTSGTLAQKELRTSQTLWCHDACQNESIVQTLLQRLQDLLQISSRHFEPIQLLQYQQGEFYGRHSDFVLREIDKRPGPRALTLLFYLNTVDGGGDTYFDALNLTVTPAPGRAILWSNCRDDNVHTRDDQAFHEALPVTAGTKYAGNIWIHLRNYQDPLEHGCL
jgi:prolyl 4-hydroxylase